MAENFIKGLGIFTGVFAGVIAGTLINMLIVYIYGLIVKKKKMKNLKFELSYNASKVQEFIKTMDDFRNRVNGDCIEKFYGYFSLSRALFSTTNRMYDEGLLQEYFDHSELGDLQTLILHLSITFEERLSAQVADLKHAATSGNYDKQAAVDVIDFWGPLFRGAEEKLNGMLHKLEKY